MVGAVDPYPAALAAHDHRLVLSEACDVGSDNRAPRGFLGCLDPLGQDQRVIGDVGEFAENFGLINWGW